MGSFVDNYNAETGKNAVYINTHGWITPELLHPGREGHKIVAKKLIAQMRDLLNIGQ